MKLASRSRIQLSGFSTSSGVLGSKEAASSLVRTNVWGVLYFVGATLRSNRHGHFSGDTFRFNRLTFEMVKANWKDLWRGVGKVPKSPLEGEPEGSQDPEVW